MDRLILYWARAMNRTEPSAELMLMQAAWLTSKYAAA
jgi:hypothetical protein